MKQILKTLFDRYQIEYTEEMLEKLNKYYNIVSEQNQTMNLTRIVSKEDFAIKNILDSVLPIKIIPNGATVVDVGTGAGLPGIPIKILRPDIKVTLIDSLQKRVNFLKKVVEIFEFKDVKCEHSRAEDFAKDNRECFDVCVSRAVARLNTLCEYCLPLVKINGIMIAYKSLKAKEELKEAKKAINILGGKIENLQNVIIKEENSIRTNIIITKIKQTPLTYPRPKNLPKTKPII